MKVFLSWSGTTSHRVACALREWLPSVMQSLIPYVSSEDIDKGARWSTDIAKELEDSRYGIICVTRENIHAPWVNFEAGALSKVFDKSFVTPFLFDLKRSDVQGPLLQFQSTIWDKDDVLKLLKSINNRSTETEKLKDDKLTRAFEVWWPQLEADLKAIEPVATENTDVHDKHKDKVPQILEELLELTRNHQKILANPTAILPPEYLQHIMETSRELSRHRRHDPEILEAIHAHLIELEETLSSHEKDHPGFIEAMSRMRRIHRMFHELPDWPGRKFAQEAKRIRRIPKEEGA
jgi:hypothetical protein